MSIFLLCLYVSAAAWLLGYGCALLDHSLRERRRREAMERALDEAFQAGLLHGVQAGLENGLQMRVTTMRAQRRGVVCGLN